MGDAARAAYLDIMSDIEQLFSSTGTRHRKSRVARRIAAGTHEPLERGPHGITRSHFGYGFSSSFSVFSTFLPCYSTIISPLSYLLYLPILFLSPLPKRARRSSIMIFLCQRCLCPRGALARRLPRAVVHTFIWISFSSHPRLSGLRLGSCWPSVWRGLTIGRGRCVALLISHSLPNSLLDFAFLVYA